MDAIRWEGNTLYLLDQTKLPVTEVWLPYTDYRPVADAIRTMVVRGAPAIGIFAGYCRYVLARQLMEQGLSGPAFFVLGRNGVQVSKVAGAAGRCGLWLRRLGLRAAAWCSACGVTAPSAGTGRSAHRRESPPGP